MCKNFKLKTKNFTNFLNMKKTILIIGAIVMMVGFSTTVKAQTAATASNTANTVLLVPMSITATGAMSFGTINVLNQAGGTVLLGTAAGSPCTYSGVAASPFKSTPACATYTVTGTYDMTYGLSITGSSLGEITLTNTLAGINGGAVASGSSTTGTATMKIDLLKVLFGNGGSEGNVGVATSQLSASGTDSFRIGGRLTVGASQASGNYSGTYNASVDYN
jgi:hypothetical protein